MKKIIKYFSLAFALFALAGCTKSFCSTSDKANMLLYYSSKQEENVLKSINEKGIACPSDNFNGYIEYKIYETATTKYSDYFEGESNKPTFGDKKLSEYSVEELINAKGKNADNEDISFNESSYYANIKFSGYKTNDGNTTAELWYNFEEWTKEIRNEVHKNDSYQTNVVVNNEIRNVTITISDLPTNVFMSEYKTQMNSLIASTNACITPSEGLYDGIYYEAKSWGDAFNLGLIEGLLEYPIAWMIHSFYNLFNMGAWGSILSILIVTVIVRLFLLAISFKSSIAQTRMQELQPELNALQAKYPNSNTDEYQKRMLAQAQADLYKKYKINPFSSLIVMIFQFPIFIAVWGAMSGSAILRVDTLFANGGDLWALKLSESMNTVMFNFSNGIHVNITAIILFVLMSAAQILSAKLPMWIQKKEQKNSVKLGKNPAQDQTNKQMNMVSNVMMIMIIFMGFTLPVGMAIYWFISAIISLAQSLIIRAISKSNRSKSQHAKYKTKK